MVYPIITLACWICVNMNMYISMRHEKGVKLTKVYFANSSSSNWCGGNPKIKVSVNSSLGHYILLATFLGY